MMKASVSQHAAQRLIERVPHLRVVALDFLCLLWAQGRPAQKVDFDLFDCLPREGREYRVCCHRRALYLVVFDPNNQTFVTLWKK